MVICQVCRKSINYGDSNCVYVGVEFSTYLCNPCYESHAEDYVWEQPQAVRTCKQCGIGNEFYSHCFTCQNDQLFWSMMRKNKVSQ